MCVGSDPGNRAFVSAVSTVCVCTSMFVCVNVCVRACVCLFVYVCMQQTSSAARNTKAGAAKNTDTDKTQ